MSRNILLILLLSAFVKANSQTPLEKKVPKQAAFVISFNLNSLSQKVNFNDLGNYNFMKKVENQESVQANLLIMELFRLPEKAGISKVGKLIMYSENHDSISNLNYLISLTDGKAFESRIIDILKTKEITPKFNKEGKLKQLNYDHKIGVSLAKDYAIISLWQTPYYYTYDYDEYNEEKNKVIQMLDSIKFSKSEMDTSAMSSEDYSDSIVEEEIIEETEPVEILVDTIVDNTYIDDATMAVEEAVPYYENTYENDSLMKQFERQWEVKRKLKEEQFYVNHDRKMLSRQKYVNEIKPNDAMATNPEYLKVMTKTDDIIYWFQYQSYSNQLIELMSDKYTYGYSDTAVKRALLTKNKSEDKNKLTALIDNNSLYGLGNFNKGEIKMNFYNSFNNQMLPYIQKIYSSSINKDFFKYIKSDNLIGLIGFSLNTEAVSNLYYEILRLASESSAIPNKSVVFALELSDLLLDKNVIHHTFKGDAVIAFTGIKSYLKTYNSYEYDSLTFESHNVEKTSTKYLPEFTTILTIENLANVKRILKMVERMGGLTKESENLYSFKSDNQEINNNFFILIKDSLFFLTNDKALTTEQFKDGLALERTLGDSYKTYLNSTSFGYWDANKMFKLMAEKPDESFGKNNELQKISDKINKGFFMSKYMVGNATETEVTLELKNRENSSLLELLKLFDDIYLLNKFK